MSETPRIPLGRTTAEQRRAWAACTHEVAYGVAHIGDPGNDDDEARGIPWTPVVADATELDGIKITGSIGVCGDCGAPVITVRMADYANWSPVHGPAWSTPWTRPIRDGEGGRPAASEPKEYVYRVVDKDGVPYASGNSIKSVKTYSKLSTAQRIASDQNHYAVRLRSHGRHEDRAPYRAQRAAVVWEDAADD